MFPLVPGEFIRPGELEITIFPGTAVGLLSSVGQYVGLVKENMKTIFFSDINYLPLNVIILYIFWSTQSVHKKKLFVLKMNLEINFKSL